MTTRSICVFCGSRFGGDAAYKDGAEAFGARFGDKTGVWYTARAMSG